MKRFIRLIKTYLLPYKYYAILNVFLYIFSAIFSLFSLTLVIPFLGILFKTQTLVTQFLEWELTLEVLKNNFYYFLSKIIIEQGEQTALLIVCIFVVILFLLKTATVYLASFFITPIRTGIIRDIRNRVYNKILALQIGFFTNSRKGDIIARVTGDVQEIEWSILNSLVMLTRDPLNIVLSLVFLFFMSAKLTLFVFILLPISALIIGQIGKSLRKTSMTGQVKMGELLSIIEETLSGLRIIKAFVAENKMKRRFYNENEKYRKIMNYLMRKRDLASPLSEFLGVIVIIVIMWYGGTLVLTTDEAMSPQELIGYLAVFYNVINPAKSFSQAFYNLQKGMASNDRINGILNAEITIFDKTNAVDIQEFKHSIEFRNVSFKYEKEYVLKNINLKIEKGQTVALVGQSGSGKSTLVDLIPRFYDIEEGEILIDGISIKNIKLKKLRALMGNVNQEPILFNDTFFNNISFGVETTTNEQVTNAAIVANAHDFIKETEKAYETNIGDRGSKLSGGQRQRISIARAVLKNPPIMILDEATSSLDTESERLVQDALTKLMQNRTSIVIAHRLSTIKNADVICVLHEGEIVERGKHEVLMEKSGIYRKLHDMQMR